MNLLLHMCYYYVICSHVLLLCYMFFNTQNWLKYVPLDSVSLCLPTKYLFQMPRLNSEYLPLKGNGLLLLLLFLTILLFIILFSPTKVGYLLVVHTLLPKLKMAHLPLQWLQLWPRPLPSEETLLLLKRLIRSTLEHYTLQE